MKAGLGGRVARGAGWIGLGRVLTNGIAFAGTVALARLLTPADFGLVAIAAGLLALYSGVTTVSPEAALIAEAEPDRATVDTAWTIAVLRSALVGLVFALSALPISLFYRDDRLVLIALALAASFSLSGLINPRITLVQKGLQFRQDFIINVASKACASAAMITTAVLTRSFWALVVGTATAQLVAIALGYALLPYRPRFTLAHWRRIISFTSWITVTQFIAEVNFRIDHLVIGGVLGARPVGQYLVSDELAALPTREIGRPLQAILFPTFATLRDDPARMRGVFLSMQALLVAVLAPLGVGLSFTAYLVVPLIYGDKWVEAVPLIAALAPIYAGQSILLAVTPLALAAGQSRLLASRDAMTLAVRMVTLTIGILTLGLAGAVVSRCVVNLVGIVVSMRVAARICGAGLADQAWGLRRTAASLAAMVAALYAADRLLAAALVAAGPLPHLIALVAVGGTAYGATHLGLWLAQGRPAGPERKLFEVVGAMLGRTGMVVRPEGAGS